MQRSKYLIVGMLSLCGTNLSASDSPLPALDCVIEPHLIVEVSSPVGGVIREIHVDKSDLVEEGQVLVRLEDALEKAEVDSARARADMRHEIASKKAALAFAKRKLTRLDDLFKSGAASFQEKDEAETGVELAELELRQAREAERVARLDLQKAIEAYNLRTINSPLSGVVMDRYKSAGESVEDKPILKIAQIDPLQIRVIAPAQLFGRIDKGMSATVIPEHQPDTRYTATVSIVDRVVDAASGTFDIRLDLPNSEHAIAGGLKCQVQITTGASPVSGAATSPGKD